MLLVHTDQHGDQRQVCSAQRVLQTSNIKWHHPEKLSMQVMSGHTCPVPISLRVSSRCPPAPTVRIPRQCVSRSSQARPFLGPALSSCLCLGYLKTGQIFWDLPEHTQGATERSTGQMENVWCGVCCQDTAPLAGKPSSWSAPACLTGSGVHGS